MKMSEKKFTEFESQLQSQGQGPLDLKCAGPPEYWGDHAPYDMRAIGLTHHRTQELDALHAQAAKVFGIENDEEPTPHTSLVYDWIGSPAVNQRVVDEIREKWPALGGSVRFDGLALVDMRDADVGEWKILDRMDFAEEEQDEEDDLETVYRLRAKACKIEAAFRRRVGGVACCLAAMALHKSASIADRPAFACGLSRRPRRPSIGIWQSPAEPYDVPGAALVSSSH